MDVSRRPIGVWVMDVHMGLEPTRISAWICYGPQTTGLEDSRDLVEEQRDILGNIPRTWLSLSCPRVGTLYLDARVFDFVCSLD